MWRTVEDSVGSELQSQQVIPLEHGREGVLPVCIESEKLHMADIVPRLCAILVGGLDSVLEKDAGVRKDQAIVDTGRSKVVGIEYHFVWRRPGWKQRIRSPRLIHQRRDVLLERVRLQAVVCEGVTIQGDLPTACHAPRSVPPCRPNAIAQDVDLVAHMHEPAGPALFFYEGQEGLGVPALPAGLGGSARFWLEVGVRQAFIEALVVAGALVPAPTQN
jgi:hypothetical protein